MRIFRAGWKKDKHGTWIITLVAETTEELVVLRNLRPKHLRPIKAKTPKVLLEGNGVTLIFPRMAQGRTVQQYGTTKSRELATLVFEDFKKGLGI